MRIDTKASRVGVVNQLEVTIAPSWLGWLNGERATTFVLQGGPPIWYEVTSGQYVSPDIKNIANKFWYATLEKK